jgi:DNA recombination-dependent growth factor C
MFLQDIAKHLQFVLVDEAQLRRLQYVTEMLDTAGNVDLAVGVVSCLEKVSYVPR